MDLQSDCGSSLSYNLTVSDTDSSSSLLLTNTSARVAVDNSDNYTVTIFASNGCPGVAVEIGEWMDTITAAILNDHLCCYVRSNLDAPQKRPPGSKFT